MSNFRQPSSSDRQASGKAKPSKKKRTIENSTEVIPNFWFPDWRGTPRDLDLLHALTQRPIDPTLGLPLKFISCESITRHARAAEFIECTPVRMPGGALTALELRWRVPGNSEYSKKFALAYRAYRADYIDETSGERQPVLLDTWAHLHEKDVGLLLPTNADELKAACDNAKSARCVAWFLCEGARSARGVKQRLDDPAVAHIVEAWKQRHGISDIVVSAWLCGRGGAEHTNFGMCAHPDMQIPGQNDWRVDFSNLGPIGRVVLVPDCDKAGKKEKEIIAVRLHDDFQCSRTRIFEVKPPPRLSAKLQGWDDFDKLPTDVTQEERVEQLLNPIQWTPTPYILTVNNKFVLNAENVRIDLVRQRMDELFYFDDFQNAPMIGGRLPSYDHGPYPRRLDDADVLKLMAHLQYGDGFEKISESMTRQGIILQSEDRHIHPIREYLKELTWDGEPRVDTLFVDYLGAFDDEAARLAAGILLKSMVGRVLWPGCTAQQVITLIGPQDVFKSMFCKILASREYFSASLPHLDNRTQMKEAQAHLAGHWLLEIAENSAFKNAESEKLKNFITMEDDIYCAKYAHLDQRHPRQCVFVITTNENKLFKDRTGNRRYVPVNVAITRTPTEEDMERLEENRDQLFAEAYYRVTVLKEKWRPTRDEEARLFAPLQAEHRALEPWEIEMLETLSPVIDKLDIMIDPRDLHAYLLDARQRVGKLVTANEYGNVMREHGWENKLRRFKVMKDGKEVSSFQPKRAWVRCGSDGGAIGKQFHYSRETKITPGVWHLGETWNEHSSLDDPI